MKEFLDKHPKIKSPYFWIGIVAIVFSAAGVDIATLTSWPLLGAALLTILNNPFTLLCVVLAIIAVFNDNSTSGIDGADKLKSIFTVKKGSDK